MKRRWILLLAACILMGGIATGCASAAGTSTPGSTGSAGLANPWKEGTVAEAATVLGGTMYNITTLDSAYEQYALLVTTDDAVQKNGMKPTAWVRFRKGDDDVSLIEQKGTKLSADQRKGRQASVNGTAAFIADNQDGMTAIAWEADGLLMEISTSTAWSDDKIVALAQGVKAVS